MKKTSLIFAACLLVTGSLMLAAQSKPSDTFSWHGELVAFDEGAKTITVKSRIFGDKARSDFGALKGGERVVVIWSGFDNYADSIKEARASSQPAEPRFAFPVDFVSLDESRNYVTFKVAIPESGVARLKSMKPGEWVTATSPHGSSSEQQPIVRIRHYNDPVEPASS